MISPVKIWRRQKEIRNYLGLKGTIVTWTKIITPGKDFKKHAPFFVVLVRLENGQTACGQLVDCCMNEVKIGYKAIGILRKVRDGSKEGVISYGLKFKLIQ